MKVHLRIVAGELRGRKLACVFNPQLRPTPDRVREALFNILREAVPGRPFIDVFAGSGIVGLEALSRGAASALFLERDTRQAHDIERHLREFGYADQAHVSRTDVYRWAETWPTPAEPVTIFVSPPFKDIQHHPEELLLLIERLQRTMPPDSTLVLQSEKHSPLEDHPAFAGWDQRKYGRNILCVWVKEEASSPP
jgi:16S rRNA (guanine966-N2)-methyltransferase